MGKMNSNKRGNAKWIVGNVREGCCNEMDTKTMKLCENDTRNQAQNVCPPQKRYFSMKILGVRSEGVLGVKFVGIEKIRQGIVLVLLMEPHLVRHWLSCLLQVHSCADRNVRKVMMQQKNDFIF